LSGPVFWQGRDSGKRHYDLIAKQLDWARAKKWAAHPPVYQSRAQRRLEARADSLLASFGESRKAKRQAESAQDITREQAAAIGLGYRIELVHDGRVRTIGRHSPWW
jgi:hypothetical protein